MNKPKRSSFPRALVLSKETLRHLNDAELRQVAAGLDPVEMPNSGLSACRPCSTQTQR